ncbi:MAG: hypothetical protein IPP78_02605 [Holophagaceae bacterium]|nr:hypothetical protein [Holophagaceae bacterium]
MHFRSVSLSFLVASTLAAGPSLKPEAPLVAHAYGLFRTTSPKMPATPADILKLNQDGDANLALGALTGRWIADRLAEGKLPDEFLFQRMLVGFTWDEAGVLQLHSAGLDKGVLRALATAKPLGLSQEAQDRLTKAGLDPRIATMLGALPAGSLPAMKSMADQAMGAMMSGLPMAQNPAMKSQLEGYQKKIETQMASKFRSDGFRKEIWDRVVDNWRSRIQVGADAQAMLAPMGTDIVNAPPEPVGAGASGMFGAAAVPGLLRTDSPPSR